MTSPYIVYKPKLLTKKFHPTVIYILYSRLFSKCEDLLYFMFKCYMCFRIGFIEIKVVKLKIANLNYLASFSQIMIFQIIKMLHANFSYKVHFSKLSSLSLFNSSLFQFRFSPRFSCEFYGVSQGTLVYSNIFCQ